MKKIMMVPCAEKILVEMLRREITLRAAGC